MTGKKLALYTLDALPYCLVAFYFGSVWPAVTLFLARFITILLAVLVAVTAAVVRIVPMDFTDLKEGMFRDVLRDVARSLLNVPTMLALQAVRLWLVWILSAPSYGVPLVALTIVLTVLHLGRMAIFGLPKVTPEISGRA